MSTREKIRGLLDEGLSPQEVADKVGVKRQTVYHYRYLFRKEDEPVTATKTKTDGKLSKLERQNTTLKAELKAADEESDRVKQDNEYLKSEINRLEEENAGLKEIATKSDIKQENERMKENIAYLSNKNEELKKKLYKREQRISELIDESRKELAKLEKELGIERAKHKHLLKYTVVTAQEESA